jgi:hypothetical protein
LTPLDRRCLAGLLKNPLEHLERRYGLEEERAACTHDRGQVAAAVGHGGQQRVMVRARQVEHVEPGAHGRAADLVGGAESVFAGLVDIALERSGVTRLKVAVRAHGSLPR